MIVTTVSISTISSGTGRQRGRRDLRKVTEGRGWGVHTVPPAVRAVAESPPTVSESGREEEAFLPLCYLHQIAPRRACYNPDRWAPPSNSVKLVCLPSKFSSDAKMTSSATL